MSAQAALATSSSSSSSSKSSSRSSRSSQSAQKRRRLNPRNELESAGAYDNSMIEESEMVDDPSGIGTAAAHATANADDTDAIAAQTTGTPGGASRSASEAI
eukprot:gene17470-12495_t